MPNACYARGNICAPIMIIGINPGEAESKFVVEGKDMDGNIREAHMPIPFCGPSGRLLHAMLEWIGIQEGDFILENAYNFGIKNDKKWDTPTDKQLEEARPSLLEKIRRVDPKLIITLGSDPLWVLCYHGRKLKDEIYITKIHGQLHPVNIPVFGENQLKQMDGKLGPEIIESLKTQTKTYQVLPLFHPSAILRDKDNERGYKAIVTKTMAENKELISNCVGRILI